MTPHPRPSGGPALTSVGASRPLRPPARPPLAPQSLPPLGRTLTLFCLATLIVCCPLRLPSFLGISGVCEVTTSVLLPEVTSQEVTPAPGQPISRSPGCLPGNSPDANDSATHSSRTDALHLAACLTLQRSPYMTAMGKEARGQQSQGQSPCSRVPAERRSRVTNCTHTLQALHTTHSSLSFPPRRFLSLCHLAPPSIPKPRTGWYPTQHSLQFSLMHQRVLMVCKDHGFQMFGTDLQN